MSCETPANVLVGTAHHPLRHRSRRNSLSPGLATRGDAEGRGPRGDGIDSRQRLRAATHHGRIQRTQEGDIVGVEVEWLLSLHDVDRRMHVRAADTVDSSVDAERLEVMPGRRRSLLTTAAREHVGQHTRASLSALGRYTLPRFGRPEALYADIL